MPFEKGKSGNPGGRPKKNREVEQLCREASPEALVRLKQIMRQQKDIKAALQAALGILAYGLGKPRQAIEMTGAEGGPIQTETITDTEAARLIAFTLAKGVEDEQEEKGTVQ